MATDEEGGGKGELEKVHLAQEKWMLVSVGCSVSSQVALRDGSESIK